MAGFRGFKGFRDFGVERFEGLGVFGLASEGLGIQACLQGAGARDTLRLRVSWICCVVDNGVKSLGLRQSTGLRL